MAENPAYTDSMNRLIDEFARLPGIGRRTAERLAFHVLKTPAEQATRLARAIDDVKTNVRHCSICFNLTESDPCAICSDPRRDGRQILVVEQPKDVIALEQTGAYRGRYHVLLGRLAPLEGIQSGDLTIEALRERAQALAEEKPGEPIEIILGTNPNLEGDGTALLVAEQLQTIPAVRLTRLARGLPSGSQLEYANRAVLSDAIHSRQKIE